MELNQFRDVDVVLDKANDNIIQKQFVSAGDKDGRSLTVQLTDNGVIGEIIGAALNLYWHNQASGLTDLSAFYVVDRATSVFKIDYPQNMLTPGKVIAYIQIMHGGKVTHTKPFEITVQKLAGTTRGVLTTAEYGALVTTLAKANEFETDIAEVTAQLADTTALLNQLKNISLYGEIKPFIVESMVDFGWVAYGTPTGYNNYPGGNLFFGISGNKGDSFVTVTSGDISHVGSNHWAAVLKDDNGNWSPVKVTGVSGNTLLIYPSLDKNILSGEIGNLHDEPTGQHYTERGYYALAQHIYKYNPKYAERNKFIASFDPQLDTLAENPFTLTSNVNSPTIFPTTPFINNITFRDSQKTLSVGGSAGFTLTHEWEVQLDNKRGFLETAVSAAGNDAKIEFYLDGVLTHSEDVPISGKVTKVYYDFANAQTGKIKIYFPTSTAFHTIYIGKTTWWLNEKEVPKLIPPHSKVVYLGDSWGVFHSKAITRELERLLTNDTGTRIEVLNDSKHGMTSKWGKAWFNEYVLKHKPTHVIIEFFTNDFNSINVPSNAYDYVAPDGQTYNGNIASVSEWVQNIFDLVNLSIEHGIQPIVVAPAPTAVDSRVLGSLNNAKLLLKGAQQ